MGNIYAAGLAEAATEGTTTLEQALVAHLVGNFYPPLPATYAKPLAEAIGAVNSGEQDIEITLPRDISPVPRQAYLEDNQIKISAAELVNACRALPFCDEDAL